MVIVSLFLVLTITMVTSFSFYENYLVKAVCVEKAPQPSSKLKSTLLILWMFM